MVCCLGCSTPPAAAQHAAAQASCIPLHPTSRASSYSLWAFASPLLSQTPSKNQTRHQRFLLSPQPMHRQAAVFWGSRGKPGLRGAEASKPAGKGDRQRGSPVSAQPNHTGCSDSSAADGETLHLQKTSIQTCPCTGRRGRRMLPLPKPSSARAMQLFEFKGCSEQIKGEKKADTICLGEANCKQFCHSADFYLNTDTDRSHCWSTARAPGVHGRAEAESAQSRFFFAVWKQTRKIIKGVIVMDIYTSAA